MNKVALANFKGLSQDGQREDFAKNIRLLLFNDDLSNCTTFSQIHHAGQFDNTFYFVFVFHT
jgi:hypothetical protein